MTPAEASRRALAAAFDQVAEAIFVTDAEGRIVFANEAFERVTGFPAAEAVGCTPRLLRSGRHDDAFYRNLWGTILAGEVWRGSVVNRRRDGSLYEAEASITPLRDSRGEVHQFVAVQRDVTALRQAQRLEALGLVVASMAHELNNPLSTLIMNLPLLEELWTDALPLLDAALAEDPEARLARLPWPVARESIPNLLAGVRRSAERLRSIAAGLKNFARPSEDRAPRRFLLDQPLRGALELTEPHARETGVRVEVHVDPELPELSGHPDRIEQVLVNLLLNAISFASAEEGRVEVRAASLGGGDWLDLRVLDNGPGVAPDLRHRLFEPFFTTRAGRGGTGLGLAISRRIAREHGGDLSLCAAPGGACFQLILPAADLEVEACERPGPVC